MAAKKLIGLTGPSTFTDYCVRLIEDRLGANFVMIYHNNMENVDDWVPRCDGIIVAGGADIHPSVYGQSVTNNRGLSKFDLLRDVRELYTLKLAFDRRTPVLGICRGHQIMGVFKGLKDDFVMDLDGSVSHQPSRSNITLTQREPNHQVFFIDPQSFPPPKAKEREVFKKVLKEPEDVGYVNSFHHQGLEFFVTAKKSLIPDGRYANRNIKVFATAATGDSDHPQIIEGMMGTGPEAHWITVQWHPEYDYEENSISAEVVNRFHAMLNR